MFRPARRGTRQPLVCGGVLQPRPGTETLAEGATANVSHIADVAYATGVNLLAHLHRQVL